jgi:hypothetical protein
MKDTQRTHVSCNGYEETSKGLLHIYESWPYWPFPQEIPLNRTDPTIPTTSEGQVVDRQESPWFGGVDVTTNTLTWKLTLEPDAGQ